MCIILRTHYCPCPRITSSSLQTKIFEGEKPACAPCFSFLSSDQHLDTDIYRDVSSVVLFRDWTPFIFRVCGSFFLLASIIQTVYFLSSPLHQCQKLISYKQMIVLYLSSNKWILLKCTNLLGKDKII